MIHHIRTKVKGAEFISFFIVITMLCLSACAHEQLSADETRKSDISETVKYEDVEYLYSIEGGDVILEVGVIIKDRDDYTLLFFDPEREIAQRINHRGSHFQGLEFMDVNIDGHMDIVVEGGGTRYDGTDNDTNDLFVYDSGALKYIPVEYIGFDFLAYFEVNEGFLRNWIKSSASTGIIQDLAWDGNILVLQCQEEYSLENE